MTRNEILDEIRKLDPEERAQLMEELSETIYADIPLTEEQWKEI